MPLIVRLPACNFAIHTTMSLALSEKCSTAVSMNRHYKLRYLPLFWEDLSQAASYIAFDLNNPAAANRLVDNVEAGILEHLKNPTMSPTYPSTRRRLHPYYRFYVGNYMVFYVVIDDVMEVRRLLYKSRDIESIIR
ncbi:MULTISPECIES: type II toxin-antitoxin system RelE/ParE family toxin [Collinsella]|uniref:type II toxin-antitoxin system RelE/ParE family toxin n=3 Tax=Coriobacteriaceae TaxID=84107 RepID=UPI002A89B482|nr:type II toxin-antitoxin system RelE/ParE family toxin [Collinsella sp.]MDY4719637.1 type II toxin-antitoxin system RelE/ParE family toxin [Collinsella sp.]MDY5438370.1 type II toxin-antitoxin system RelE/ParE family toxin [Collinsella sp.]MDY5561388.1 type II toxin-antitoxin system RelE/ParE family toxin [Collinsella sp.]